jgi:methyl-accepting chemotaxis protein
MVERLIAMRLFYDLSLFRKCILLIVCSATLIAGFLTILNIRSVNTVIDDGVRALAAEITEDVAYGNGAALRFGNVEAVDAAIGEIIATSLDARHALAVNAQGETMVEAGEAAQEERGALRALLEAALREGTTQVSPDGFLMAVPSFAGSDRQALAGGVAIGWSSDHRRAEAASQQIVKLVLSAFVLGLLVTVAGILLKQCVSDPISRLVDEIVKLGGGRHDSAIPFANRRDEVGTIARNLVALQRQLADAAEAARVRAVVEQSQKRVVEELTIGLQTVANGDLTRRIEMVFAPEYEKLRANFNETVDTIVRVIEQMARNADTIRESAETIAQSSSDLSRRTENQAASLEETAAALDMITGNVEASAGSAQNVEKIVVDARSRATQSASVVRETVDAMAQIEDSARQIARITSVIDEIAFQTNLLALNAGVEAARAGDAGRGFSVVANEVRALAQRSSDAANEIKALIGDSSAHVERGVRLVASAGAELGEITERVAEISGHVEGISKSAREQSVSLGEVNSGVAQLDRVTQQNAAMVSQANDASQVLREEANAMAEIISVFRLPGRAAAESVPGHRLAG